jgi:hypothetical protein
MLKYPAHLDEPILQSMKVRVSDTTLSVAFTGIRRTASGFSSHYELIIKRKGGEYWYSFTLRDPFGKARLYESAIVETFAKFLRRISGVDHRTCPVCRSLKLNPDVIDRLKERVAYGEYTRL